MAITTFEFYSDVFYGTLIKQIDFPKYASKAEDELDYITNGHIDEEAWATYCLQIQKAVCALAELDFQLVDAEQKAQNAQGSIHSISSGGESVSFNVQATAITAVLTDRDAQQRLRFETVRPYLYNTGLLYQGL